MATESIDYSFQHGHGCSICLDTFTAPRQLPCLHSFCEHCLQDYITKKACSTDQIFVEFMCPVCRAITRPANNELPATEWASLFPNSPLPLMGKSKVERSCEVCSNSTDNSNNLAKNLCVVCEEFMCDDCVICHKNMKMTKDHLVIGMEQLETNPHTCLKFLEESGCPEHDNEDIKFYCSSHETACCGTCSFLHHTKCQNVLQLKEILPGVLKDINTHKIMDQLRKFECHLKNVMEINEKNICIVESHVNNITSEIGDIRKKLNDVLDDIEKMVKLEGNRIYKEWVIKKQEQNHQCQSLISAIRNSQAVLEMVGKFGSDKQNFLVSNKTIKQLQCYSDEIREKFERVDNIIIRLELDSNIKAVLSKDAGGLMKIVCQEEAKDLKCKSRMTSLRKRTVELSRVIDVQCPSEKNPEYRGIVLLPDGYIVLSDYNDIKTCCLHDSSCSLTTSYILPGNPYGMCLIGANEVAITIPDMKTVQFISISNRSFTYTGTLTAKYIAQGVDAVTREEIVVSGHCGSICLSARSKCYWSLITRKGIVKAHHEFYCCKPAYHVNVALDMSKSRVYISVGGGNGVYCFGLRDGKRYFVYSSNDLKFPLGVAVDREDNVFVVGYNSNNIHKLSPDGITLQVITSGVPKHPVGISLNHSKDHFIITNDSYLTSRKLHYFVHK